MHKLKYQSITYTPAKWYMRLVPKWLYSYLPKRLQNKDFVHGTAWFIAKPKNEVLSDIVYCEPTEYVDCNGRPIRIDIEK